MTTSSSKVILTTSTKRRGIRYHASIINNAQRGTEEHLRLRPLQNRVIKMKKNLYVFLLAGISCISCTQNDKQKRIQDSLQQERIRHVADSLKPIYDSIRQEERIKQEEERIKKLKKRIRITNAWLSSPNSAGGVDANVYYKNLSSKTIKYFEWSGYPINAVGDRVGCEIRGFDDFHGKDTGPVKPGHSGGGCWSCAWYNYSARKLIITKVEITYMDGSSLKIKESDIPYIWK